jgi:DNA repair exonuclease SbcCD ATPase subunit
MGFLDRVRSTVGQGVARVTSEADKTIKLTRLSGELGGKRHELEKAYQDLGELTYAQMQAGKVQFEGFDEVRQRIEDVQAQVKTLEAELAEIRVGDKTPEVKVTSVERPCPSCGKSVPEGMGFCGYCGHTME